MKSTKGIDYTRRLSRLSGARWKKVLDVQRPYRWNIKKLDLGPTLDVGCGIGRLLSYLPAGSIGVDHNKESISIAKKTGYDAYTTKDFLNNKFSKNSFSSLLLAHVLEHMPKSQGKKIIKEFLPYIKNKVVVICPQEKGFKTDLTHVNYLSREDIQEILVGLGLVIDKSYSFPLPRIFGKVFTHNETIVVAKKI